MGGYSFRTDQGEEVYYMNLPARNIWGVAVLAAEEDVILKNACCPWDEDRECQRRGCLQKDADVKGRVMSLPGFLMMNRRVLAIIGAGKGKDMTNYYSSLGVEYCDPREAVPLLLAFIKALEKAVATGDKEIIMLDRLSDPDFYPCPREWWTSRAPGEGEFGDSPPVRVFEDRKMSYDEAVEKQRSGEWEAQINRVWARC